MAMIGLANLEAYEELIAPTILEGVCPMYNFFGTSRWTQSTNTTGLATYTTRSNQNTQMSIAWSAPEVLDSHGTTYKSDIYSFGIVVWEVLSR
eukprot:g21092.t1